MKKKKLYIILSILSLLSIIILIYAAAPSHNSPVLNSTINKNKSSENITCYNVSTVDTDNNIVTNIYNFYKDNKSLTLLNMPLEIAKYNGTKNETQDYSMNYNNGTIIGWYGSTYEKKCSFTNGSYGRAFNFSSSSEHNCYLNLTTKPTLENLHNFTLEFWFKTESGTTYPSTQYVISKGDGVIGNGEFALSIATTQKISILLDGSTAQITTPAVITQNKWYHLALAVTSNDKMDLYLNGELNATDTTIGTTAPYLHANFDLVVSSNRGVGNFFNGTIDEIRIYNYTLSYDQIYAHYQKNYSVITSSETYHNESYVCTVTPNDGSQDGIPKNSSTLLINTPPYYDVNSNWTNASVTEFNRTIRLNLTWHDDKGIDSYAFATNNSGVWKNETNITLANDLTNYNVTALLNVSVRYGQSFGWRFWCNDTSGEDNQSINYTLTIEDITNPRVTITHPINTTSSPNTYIDVTFTADDEGNKTNCSLSVSGGGNNWNRNVGGNSTSFSRIDMPTVTHNTNYGINVTCYDLAGNSGAQMIEWTRAPVAGAEGSSSAGGDGTASDSATAGKKAEEVLEEGTIEEKQGLDLKTKFIIAILVFLALYYVYYVKTAGRRE